MLEEVVDHASLVALSFVAIDPLCTRFTIRLWYGLQKACIQRAGSSKTLEVYEDPTISLEQS